MIILKRNLMEDLQKFAITCYFFHLQESKLYFKCKCYHKSICYLNF